jgi:hypothetical protein
MATPDWRIFPRLERKRVTMLAGELTAARDLHFLLKKHFATVEKIDETNVKVLVEAAVNQRKRELTNQYVQGEFAIPYDENSIEQPRIKSRQSNAPTPFRIYPP